MAFISRQMTDMKQMMTYMMQKLCEISGTGNTTNNTEQAPSHSTNNTLSEETSLMSGSVTATYVDTALSSSSTAAIDEQFSDIPSHCRIAAEDLIKIKRQSKSIGNFAALLTMRLFPELFTTDNLRFRFNYNGNGHQKEALETQRRSYLQRYMLYFYPHLTDSKAYHSSVIDHVNEILRRKKLKTC